MNEGATKEILVTTSDYGPDAYAFAKDKPITLLNGAPSLLAPSARSQSWDRSGRSKKRFLGTRKTELAALPQQAKFLASKPGQQLRSAAVAEMRIGEERRSIRGKVSLFQRPRGRTGRSWRDRWAILDLRALHLETKLPAL